MVTSSSPVDIPIRISSSTPGMLATLTLVNDGAASQTPGVPTQSFGWLFKEGDIPSGQAPIFQVSGISQPFSASVPAMRTYHIDGSLKFCSFSLRPTFTLGAGASQAVTVLSGGAWPAPSSRTLNEVYLANLAVSLPASPVAGGNLTGNWGAWLKNDSNLVNSGALAPSKDMDGDAGARWRITTNCAQTQGGARHGQLAFDWYIHALNNSSGGLGGFRWGGCVTQPWYNQASESPSKNWRAYATPDYVTPANGPNWTASGVSAQPIPWRGYDGNPITAKIFTVSSGTLVIGTNNWCLGSSDSNVLPCYFTTTGSLPSGLDTTSIFFAKIGQSSAPGQPIGTGNNLLIYSGSPASSAYLVNPSGGTGTHTVHPVPATSAFCRTWFLDDNGRYLFFQGAGSIVAESTLRATIDRTYWQSTGLIPPWDLTLVGGSSVSETAFNSPYHPHGIAACQQDADGQTGVVHGLGIMPNDCVIDFYKQNARSDRALRCYGFTWSHIPGNFRDATTNSWLNMGQPGASYTGLAATVGGTTFQWTNGGDDSAQPWNPPPINAYGMGMTSIGSTEHQANYPLWAWLRTGERQFCDFIQEMAIAGVVAEEPGSRDTDVPVVGRKCLAHSFHNQWRTIAWRIRDLGQAANYCPYDPTNPTALGVDGTQHVKMLVDNANLGYQQVKDAMTLGNDYFHNGATSFSSRFVTNGMWCPRRDFDGLYLVVSPEWEYCYLILCACMDAARDSNTSRIIDFLNTSATRWNHYRTQYGPVGAGQGFYGAFGYYVGWGDDGGANAHIGTLLPFEFTTPNYNSSNVTWNTTAAAGSGNEFSDHSSWANGYTVQNGDFLVPDTRPAGVSPTQIYYVRNLHSVGGVPTFGLATDQAGTSPVTITNTGSTTASGFPSGALDWCNHNSPFAMGTENLLSMRASALWQKAQMSRMGAYTSQVDALNTDMENRRVSTPGGPYGPVQTVNYGSGSFSDVRYCYADHYG